MEAVIVCLDTMQVYHVLDVYGAARHLTHILPSTLPPTLPLRLHIHTCMRMPSRTLVACRCRDYSAALSLPTVAKFWEALGVDASREYTTQLLHAATRVLKASWAPWGTTPGT